LTDHLSIGVLTATVPRFLVDEVISECNRREKRSRLLPAHVVVYFVMALALFADGYEEVIRALVNGLRYARTWSTGWAVPTSSALAQARVRLGEEVMAELFWRVAVPVAKAGTPGAWCERWRVMAIDGVMLDLPDTPANLAEYPKQGGTNPTPYPQARVVALAECGTHAILDATIGSMATGERELAAPLTRSVEASDLVTADRGFYSFDAWRTWAASGAQLAWRVSKTTALPVVQVLPDGSYLSQIHARGTKPATGLPVHDAEDDPATATHLWVRVIEYHVGTDGHDADGAGQGETYRLITTILRHEDAEAQVLAAVYAQRWEIESALREIQCQLRTPGTTLRSKTPAMVRQEIWGLLLTHYAIRAFMTDAVDTLEIDPDRLSTIRAINIIRRTVTDAAAFPPAARNRRHAHAVADLLENLNPPRLKRTYPRVNKRGSRHTFPTKNTTHHHQTKPDRTITIKPAQSA
jgi:hypothetical protein